MENTVRYRQYKFKFYLNASHSIYIDGSYGDRHPHTWEISLQILKLRGEFVTFNSLEKEIELFLEKYQDMFINEIAPFNTLNPTLENICIYFRDQFRVLLNRQGWLLLMIEIGETPTRSYIINMFSDASDEPEDDIQLQKKECSKYISQEEQAAEEIADNIIKDMIK